MATKRTRTTTTTSISLPFDIVRIILSRLPSKSLLRFRCVCKSWRDLITDSKFIEFHRNENNNDHILTLHRHYEPARLRFALCCEKTLMEHTRLDLPFLASHERSVVSGVNNGLVWFCIFSDANPMPQISSIILWNPSIRKWKVLPFEDEFTHHVVAFGYVPRGNDYKVLKFDSIRKGYEVEIYSLSTNSWKRIENLGGCVLGTTKIVRVVNGVAHLMAFDIATGLEFILRFDMADELFTRIKIPRFSYFTKIPIMFGEELVLLCVTYYGDPLTWTADIWAFKDDATAEESWTKVFTTDKLFESLGFLKNGELVWRSRPDQGGILWLYDPRLPNIMDLNTWEFPPTVDAVYHYTENLTLLNEGD